MESVETNNQVEYTQEEKDLAARHKVEPKLVRLLKEIVEEHFAEPEQTEEQEQPEDFSIDQQTQQRIKDFYKSLDPKAKLAIATLFELQALDGINFQFRQKEGRLMDEVWGDLESTCAETFHRKPDEDIPFGINDTEDVWLVGVWEACRMVARNT